MKILTDMCIGCGLCVPFCPLDAIHVTDKRASIDDSECVECGVCRRAKVCKNDAIEQNELKWPRVIRAQFSNPLSQHLAIEIEGRGTEEMKTNDLTNRIGKDQIGIGMELGRPGVSTNFGDVERVCMAMAKFDVKFEDDNPVTTIIDKKTGKLLDKYEDARDERALSAIVEIIIEKELFSQIYPAIVLVSDEIDTVFSLDLMFRDMNLCKEVLKKYKIKSRPNAKINVGMAVV